MAPTPLQSVEYFDTYEAREEAFRMRVNALIPRKYGGPGLFWQDFGQISFDRLPAGGAGDPACITSNPRDCLAFGTPWQVLSAGWMRAAAAGAARGLDVESVADDFGIGAILHQPIRSLSGGETVKLAMAKAFTTAGCSSRLTIASPFSWLSANNVVYYHKLGARCTALGVPVEVLALDGENSTAPIGREDPYLASTAPGVGFDLVLEDVGIPLGTFLHEFQGRRPCAEVDDGRFQLRSPCLLVGENGQGKSLVAKALARAVDISGRAGIDASGGGGRIRLLFQDVVTQTLLRTFDDLAAQPTRSDGAACLEVFGRIAGHLGEALAACGQAAPRRDESGTRSLLDIKAILIAARLAAPCSALILDEPDWGLTRASAVALVSAAVNTAHGMGVPVILISHKPWWAPIAASSLTAERGAAGPDGSFRIRLSMGRGGGR